MIHHSETAAGWITLGCQTNGVLCSAAKAARAAGRLHTLLTHMGSSTAWWCQAGPHSHALSHGAAGGAAPLTRLHTASVTGQQGGGLHPPGAPAAATSLCGVRVWTGDLGIGVVMVLCCCSAAGGHCGGTQCQPGAAAVVVLVSWW